MSTKTINRISAIGGDVPTNGAEEVLGFSEPYTVSVEIQGTSDLLFHRYNVEEVDRKGKEAKGSKGKKTDNVESYVWRNQDGYLCVPGEYVRQSVIHAAKFRQDPRSPRKSAMDMFKAGIVCLTELASLDLKEWHYEDRRRVIIQRSAITRTRPAVKVGWKISVDLMIILPQYITPDLLHDVMIDAGRLVGVGDFRPTYGRFLITQFKIIPR
jgi:hypothetical protein